MKKIGIITFEDFDGRKDIGSAMIRAKWIISKWKEAGPDLGEAELFKFGEKYDAVIFQKAYWHDYAENFKGVKILDICDADFLHWAYPIKRTMVACNAVTCSSEKLATALVDFAELPVYYIPDCILEPEKLPHKKHSGPVKKVAWFGYSENFPMLDAAVPALAKRGLELIVVAPKPYSPGMHKIRVENYPWMKDTWIGDISKADMVINPRFSGGRFMYKSDNKTVQAWSLGLPVAHDDKELDHIIALSPEARQEFGDERRKWVQENRDVKKAVEMFKKALIDCGL